MVLSFLGGSIRYYSSTSPGVLIFSLSFQTISVLNIIHVASHFRGSDFSFKMGSKVFFVIMNIHATRLEESPKLSSTVMPKMSIFFQMLIKIEHTGWKVPIAEIFDVSEGEFMIFIEFLLIHSLLINLLDSLGQEYRKLIISILGNQLIN